MWKPVSLIIMLMTVGSAQQPTAALAEVAISTSSNMPRGIHRTDGHAAVNISVAGKAQCRRLTTAERDYALAQANAVRAQAGLPPLRLDPRLLKAAEAQACDMAARGVMDHRGTSSSGPGMRVKKQGYKPRITAENIAAGASSLFGLQGTMQEWAGSPKHRANTLLPQVRHMGIGRALSPDGRVTFWSAVFAAPK